MDGQSGHQGRRQPKPSDEIHDNLDRWLRYVHEVLRVYLEEAPAKLDWAKETQASIAAIAASRIPRHNALFSPVDVLMQGAGAEYERDENGGIPTGPKSMRGVKFAPRAYPREDGLKDGLDSSVTLLPPPKRRGAMDLDLKRPRYYQSEEGGRHWSHGEKRRRDDPPQYSRRRHRETGPSGYYRDGKVDREDHDPTLKRGPRRDQGYHRGNGGFDSGHRGGRDGGNAAFNREIQRVQEMA